MTKTFEAIFDGKVFQPEGRIGLKPNTRVRITVETDNLSVDFPSFLETARSLKLEGPEDWSKNLEAYLYGYEQK